VAGMATSYVISPLAIGCGTSKNTGPPGRRFRYLAFWDTRKSGLVCQMLTGKL
jgi:hypothetical protein